MGFLKKIFIGLLFFIGFPFSLIIWLIYDLLKENSEDEYTIWDFFKGIIKATIILYLICLVLLFV